MGISRPNYCRQISRNGSEGGSIRGANASASIVHKVARKAVSAWISSGLKTVVDLRLASDDTTTIQCIRRFKQEWPANTPNRPRFGAFEVQIAFKHPTVTNNYLP